jgi:uncharacterized membrane protein SirB2
VSYLTILIWAGQGLVERFKLHPQWAAGLWLVVGLLFIAFAARLVLSDHVTF